MIHLFFERLLKTFSGYFRKSELTVQGGYAEIWRIAWPLVILSASNTIMMLTNRVFLAWNSPEEIAAAMPAGQMFFTLMAFFLITTGFTATIVAQFHGANDRVGCVRAAWNGFYFGAMVAALLMFALPAGGSWIIMHNGHSAGIAQYEREYFVAMAPCAGFTCMETAFLSFFTGRGKTMLVAAVKVAGCLVCVPLNYILIFGKLGLPPLGILGGGLGNSFANLFTMLTAITLFLCVKQSEYPTREHRRFHWEFVKKLVFFGAPAGLQTFIRNAAFAIVVMMIGNLGDEALAATSIALTINMLGNMPMIGLLDATSVITGQYIGRRKLNVANRIAGRSLRLLFVWMLTASLFYIFAPELLIRLFSSHNASSTGMNFEQVTANVISILHWAVIFNLLDGTRFITMGSLRGAGDTRIPLLIGMATSWLIQIPGTILLVYVIHATVSEVWMLITFYIFIDAALMLWRRGTGAWRRIKVIELPAAGGDGDEKSEAAVC